MPNVLSPFRNIKLPAGPSPDAYEQLAQTLPGDVNANALLRTYGLSFPTNVDNNMIAPQGSWITQHPRLLNAIQSGLIAASNIGPSRTIGEGISNAARGILSVKPTEQQHMFGQLMAPVQVAQQLGTLQQLQDAHTTGNAMANFYQAHANQLNYVADGQAAADKAALAHPRKYVRTFVDENLNRVGELPDGTTEQMMGPDGKTPLRGHVAEHPGGYFGGLNHIVNGTPRPTQPGLERDQWDATKREYDGYIQSQGQIQGGKTRATIAANNDNPEGETPSATKDLNAAHEWFNNQRAQYGKTYFDSIGSIPAIKGIDPVQQWSKVTTDLDNAHASYPAAYKAAHGKLTPQQHLFNVQHGIASPQGSPIPRGVAQASPALPGQSAADRFFANLPQPPH